MYNNHYGYPEQLREGRPLSRAMSFTAPRSYSSGPRGYPGSSPSAYDSYSQASGNALGLHGAPPPQLAVEPYRTPYQIYGPPLPQTTNSSSSSLGRPPSRSASSGALSLYKTSRTDGSPSSFYSYDAPRPSASNMYPTLSHSAPAANHVPFPSTPRRQDTGSSGRSSRPEERPAQPAPILRSSSSHHGRRRRRSSVSFAAGPPTVFLIGGNSNSRTPSTHTSSVNASSYHHSHRSSGDRDHYNERDSGELGSILIERKDALSNGVRIVEAQVPRSEGGPTFAKRDSYLYGYVHAVEKRVNVKIKWMNYPSVTYSIPVDEHMNGYLRVSSLARRVAKTCIMYFQANNIQVHIHQVHLHRLDEIAYGLWQPVLSVQ